MKKHLKFKQVSFSIFVLFLFAPLYQIAQNINGQVLDERNKPIDNAHISSKKTGKHWHCNPFGEFEIKNMILPDTLIITMLGYEKEIIPLSEKYFHEKLIIKMSRKSFDLSELQISGNIKSLNVVTDIDINVNPVNSSQEILRNVPGLIIGQHAGGGKAEQMFLRGFDIDHGTDINITVDGLPVNMVSHAHGQGYADLHFLIPEIIEKVDFGKGPYYANKGNFTTSGYVEFITKEKLDENEVSLAYGMFNTLRTTTLLKLVEQKNTNAYFAGEFLMGDGPFDSPQNLRRLNLFGKANFNINPYDKLSITASHLTSKWNASGQIPQRAVDSGWISRFGAIDNTEGGATSRTNLSVHFLKYINNKTSAKAFAYFSNYNFDLFSNFTLFLNDTINGDQIRQKENRNIIGSETEISHLIQKGKTDVTLKGGLGFRYDDIEGIELSHTVKRRFLNYITLGDISETNVFAYFKTDIDFGKWLINPAVRLDFFRFSHVNLLDTNYENRFAQNVICSPKLNIIYNLSSNVQFYLKNGVGFHSNDTRLVLTYPKQNSLPLAYGSDLGTILKPFKRLVLNAAVWYLFLENELVYVGDEGIVDLSGKTRRLGVDFGIRLQITKHLFFNNDINYAYARGVIEPEGKNYIPLAPELTNTGGIFINDLYGFSGGIKYRYLGNRPANEDYSITAKGYFVTDVSLSYKYKSFATGINIENLFNTKWNETQFATESRLQNETHSVEEIHFIPGTPFFIKGQISISF